MIDDLAEISAFLNRLIERHTVMAARAKTRRKADLESHNLDTVARYQRWLKSVETAQSLLDQSKSKTA